MTVINHEKRIIINNTQIHSKKKLSIFDKILFRKECQYKTKFMTTNIAEKATLMGKKLGFTK
jgi:hypothetical protein